MDDFEKLSYHELRSRAKEEGVSAGGTMAEIISRLRLKFDSISEGDGEDEIPIEEIEEEEAEEGEEEEEDETGQSLFLIPLELDSETERALLEGDDEIAYKEKKHLHGHGHHHHKHAYAPMSIHLSNLSFVVETCLLIFSAGMYKMSVDAFDIWQFMGNLFRQDFLIGACLTYYIWLVIIPMIVAVFINIEKKNRYSVFSFAVTRIAVFYSLHSTQLMTELFSLVSFPFFTVSTMTSLLFVIWEHIVKY